MTLMPVSRTSVVGSSSSKAGAGRWMGHLSVSAGRAVALVDGLAEQVEEPAERRLAHRHGDGLARCR